MQQQHGETEVQGSRGLTAMYIVGVPHTMSRELGARYTLAGASERAICLHNAGAAAACGRADLQCLWNFVASILDTATTENQLGLAEGARQGVPIVSNTPLQRLVDSVLAHYTRAHDVQTLAMLTCVFAMSERRIRENAPAQPRPVSPRPARPRPARPPLRVRSDCDGVPASPASAAARSHGDHTPSAALLGLAARTGGPASFHNSPVAAPAFHPRVVLSSAPGAAGSTSGEGETTATGATGGLHQGAASPMLLPAGPSSGSSSSGSSSSSSSSSGHTQPTRRHRHRAPVPLFGAGGPLAPLTALNFSARDARVRAQLKQEQDHEQAQQEHQQQQEQEEHAESPHEEEAAAQEAAPPRLLLDAADARLHASFRLEYIDLLQRWQLFPQMIEVLTCHRTTAGAACAVPSAAFSMPARCARCGAACAGAFCAACHAHTARCALCELPVRGLGWACPHCHHGGHLDHMVRWFARSTACPLGCGCSCPPPLPPTTGIK